ncbi:MAG: nucleotidyltransferase family protein [Oscillospiraceae bacterium]|nr:nucleotidyltransferase family protein [Oscillospiraceae bacterium]
MKELQSDSFDLTHRTIFGLLGQQLFGVPFVLEADVDWKAVLQESRHQAVCYQVFADCHQLSGLDGELKDVLRSLLVRSMMKNMQVHAQHTDLHRLMTEHGIPYVTLKGAASARYYPDPQSRAMGDVDFYVPEGDFDRALAVCQEAGFEASGLDHICHVILRKGRIHMEMHRIPAGVPDGTMGEIVKGYLSNLQETAEIVSSPLVTCCCPSDFHHGLIMLMHLQHHLLAEGIGLRHLSDWAVFVNRFQEKEFPDLFREKLKAVGLWRLARLLSLGAVECLGLPEQGWMQETAGDRELAHGLMEDILAGGNFGAKDRQRIYEGLFISNRGKDGVRSNRIRQGVQAMNRITYMKYPFIEKCPVLLPFGWVAAFGGYLVRTRERNKKGQDIHALSAFQKSAARIDLYRQLGLYEPE